MSTLVRRTFSPCSIDISNQAINFCSVIWINCLSASTPLRIHCFRVFWSEIPFDLPFVCFFLHILCRLPALQPPAPTATVFQRPNACATTYHYTSARWGFCCCRTAAATVKQSPSRTATTWSLRRTIPSGAKDAFVLMMTAAPCVRLHVKWRRAKCTCLAYSVLRTVYSEYRFASLIASACVDCLVERRQSSLACVTYAPPKCIQLIWCRTSVFTTAITWHSELLGKSAHGVMVMS